MPAYCRGPSLWPAAAPEEDLQVKPGLPLVLPNNCVTMWLPVQGLRSLPLSYLQEQDYAAMGQQVDGDTIRRGEANIVFLRQLLAQFVFSGCSRSLVPCGEPTIGR